MTNIYDVPRVTSLDLTWPGVDSITPLVKRWAQLLYTDELFATKAEGIDYFVDNDLNISSSGNLIVTRWGKSGIRSSFHCITGYALFDMLPWWKKMHNLVEQYGLHPWLPYPCILISESNLRRHSDVGRPTALNYGIFGGPVTRNYIWYDSNLADSEYSETYQYTYGKTFLIDTTVEHGGSVEHGFSSTDTRAICNMGFKEKYDVCLDTFRAGDICSRLNDIMHK